MTRTRITAAARADLASTIACRWIHGVKGIIADLDARGDVGTAASWKSENDTCREYVLDALRERYGQARYEDLTCAQVSTVVTAAGVEIGRTIRYAALRREPWLLSWHRRHTAWKARQTVAA